MRISANDKGPSNRVSASRPYRLNLRTVLKQRRALVGWWPRCKAIRARSGVCRSRATARRWLAAPMTGQYGCGTPAPDNSWPLFTAHRRGPGCGVLAGRAVLASGGDDGTV